MVEEREIGRRPKLPCRCISFCFPGNVWWWFLSNGLCAVKSLWSISRGVWEEHYIQTSAWSNGGFQRYGHRSIIASSKFCTSLSSWILYLFIGYYYCFKVTSLIFNWCLHLQSCHFHCTILYYNVFFITSLIF